MSSRFFDEDEPLNRISGLNMYWHSPLVSLERAASPLVDSIPNIGDLVQQAKTNCFKSLHALTHDESAAIYLYTMEQGDKSVYKILNRVLRANNKKNALPWFAYLKLFSTGLKKLPSYSGNVWRATPGDVSKRYKKNTKIYWWAFTSCTKSIDITKQFLPENANDGTVFMIECINAKDISLYSAYGKEDEIILMSGTMLVTMGELPLMNDVRVVHMKEFSAVSSKLVPLKQSLTAGNLHFAKNKELSPPKPVHKSMLKNKAPSQMLLPKIPVPNKKSTDNQTKKLTCPHCMTALKSSGQYRCGERVNCVNCKKAFKEIPCPSCGRSNISRNANYHAGSKVTCVYCNKIFQHLNCPHCGHAAFWYAPNEHRPGFRTCCRSCQQTYQTLNCPNCNTAQYFKNDNYKAGLRYKCSSCYKVYQAINCPHCSRLCTWRNGDRKPGFRITCWNCKGAFQHINCPKCSEPCVWEKANRVPGYRITCHECQTVFQHLNCPHCQESNVWLNGEYEQRARVICCVCKGAYQHATCSHCQQANYFSGADLKSNERIICCRCKDTF